MAAPEVTLSVNMEGMDQVNAAFDAIGNKSAEVASKVSANTNTMDMSYRRLALTTAGIITNSVQLADIMHRMATGQMDAARGALMLGMNLLQLAAQIWVVVGAEHARAIAHAIAHGVGTLGLAVPLMIAAAAAGVAIGAMIPSRQYGGPVFETGPYLLHAGEYVMQRGGSAVTINIYGAGSPRETGDAVVDALRRAGVVT
jgi:hypothetical protein